MPGYSEKALQHLEPLAQAVFESGEVRDWLLSGTKAYQGHAGAVAIPEEQRSCRWRTGPTKQPFWANYWCGLDTGCVCRPENSTAIVSDAIFFLRNAEARTLAIHVEFKQPAEALSPGQAEAYPRRAACFAKPNATRNSHVPHEDWVTVLVCHHSLLSDERVKFFDRVVTHKECASRIAGWPGTGSDLA